MENSSVYNYEPRVNPISWTKAANFIVDSRNGTKYNAPVCFTV